MKKKDKIAVALDYAMEILKTVGLGDWSVCTNRRSSVIAIMNHDEKTISYSDRYITIATKEDFYRATIHEATHALLGKGKGHGSEFVELCTKLSPEYPFSGHCTVAPIQLYRISCSNCGSYTMGNKKDYRFCGECASSGRGMYKLDNTINKLEVGAW